MKKLIAGIVSATLLSGLVVGGVMANQGSASDPTPPDLTPQVKAQQTQLENHEARITNTESDVKDLQNKTATPPSVTRVEVPAPTPTPEVQPTPAPVPEPTPVTVVAYEQIAIENSEDMDCKYTYSDATVFQFHWKHVYYNQGTRFESFNDWCDSRAIGSQDHPGA